MKNTILKFETEDLDEFIVPNYFSKEIRISDLFDSEDIDMNEYITYYEITDNDKIERISLELYGTSNYWDIILLLNDKDPLFDIPIDFTILYDTSTSFVETYANIIYSHKPLTSESRLEALQEEYMNGSIYRNEINRTIKIIKPSKMSEFIKFLKKEEYI